MKHPIEHATDAFDSLPAGAEEPVSDYIPFPVSELPPVARQIVEDVARSVGVDPAAAALPLLSAAAGCIGNSRVIELKPGFTQPAVLWTAVVMKSGCGKTPARGPILQPLQDREDELIARHLQDVKAVKAAAKARKGDISGEDVQEPLVCPRTVVQDATVEALAVRLAGNPRGLLADREELQGWFQSFNSYRPGGKGGDTSHWLAIFDAKSLRMDRKGDPAIVHAPRAAVSITGGIQPAVLRRVMSLEHFQEGMAARFLLAMPDLMPIEWREDGIDPETGKALKKLYDGLLALATGSIDAEDEVCGEPVKVGLSPEAKAVYINFFNMSGAVQPELNDADSAAQAKLRGYAARLALVLHLIRVVSGDGSIVDPYTVGAESMEGAVVLTRWFEHEAKRVYRVLGAGDDAGADPDREAVLRYVRKHGGDVAVTQIQSGVSRFKGQTAALKALLKRLEAEGVGHFKFERGASTRGPSTERFRLS